MVGILVWEFKGSVEPLGIWDFKKGSINQVEDGMDGKTTLIPMKLRYLIPVMH